ncbi:MAG: hypothetical protein VX589_19840 [Myxococcota bacterium]|nr:hypothetical protein [Myxococcota bacterium]
MYTLFLSFGMALFTAIVPTFFGVSSTWTVLPGMILGVVVFVWSSRRVSKRVEAVTQRADQEMAKAQAISQRAGAKAPGIMLKAIDASVSVLKTGLIFQKWQFGIGTMLNARIGMLLFSKAMVHQQSRQKNEVRQAYLSSIPFLTASQVKGKKARLLHALWPAWAMLAIAHYRTEDNIEGAVQVLEGAVNAAPKVGLLWNIYGWILWKEKRLDEAIAVLVRGKEKADTDKRLDENLTALQNRKGMKMKGYGQQWYQFGLEQPRVAAAQGQIGHPRMRGGSRRR